MNDTTTRFERIGTRLAQAVTQRPKLTLWVYIGAFLLGSIGLVWARFSTDYQIFFSHEDPGLTAFQNLERDFTKTDNVLFVVKAREGTVFQPDALHALQALTLAGWQLPYASRVDSLTNFQQVTADGDDLAMKTLVPDQVDGLTAQQLDALRLAAQDEPILLGSLLSLDTTTAAVNVTLRLPRRDPLEVTEAAGAARGVVAAVNAKYPSLDIRPSGMAFINDAFMQVSIEDMALMIPLMVIAMLVVMGFIVRSAKATGAVAVIIWMSATLSMAVAGWLRYPLSPTSVAAPMIVLTVAVADGVHIVLGVLAAMRSGLDKRSAIIDSVQSNLEAVTYTWLTTLVGFVCLNSSDAPPVTHLANMTCVGVTVAWLFSVTLLPALLMMITVKVPAARQERAFSFMGRLADAVIRRRAIIFIGAAVLTISSAIAAAQLEPNDQFVSYFSQRVPFRRDVDFTMKHLSGIYRLEFQVGSDGVSGVTSPQYLKHLEAFAQWLRTQPEVHHVFSVTDILKRTHQVMNGGEAREYRLPDTREAAAQSLLLYEMNLPAGLDLTDRVNIDKSASRLTVTVADLSTRQMTNFAERSGQWLRTNAPQAMWAQATGPVVIFSQLGDRNARSMVKADFLSLLLISLCMIIVLRSWKLGLISVIPNVVPIFVGYGVWYLVVGQLNIVASIAASIALGIIVDDTIHFLTKFQALQRREGMAPEQAMRHTLLHVGPAMLSTSVILVIGFGVLTLSSFQMTSHLGWLCLLIVGIAPIADLLIAPALVLLLVRPAKPQPERLVLQVKVSGS